MPILHWLAINRVIEVTRILAIELMAAAEGIDFRRPLRSSEALESAHSLVRSVANSREEDREFSGDIEAVANRIENGDFQPLVSPLLQSLGHT